MIDHIPSRFRVGVRDVAPVRCFYHPGYTFPLPEEHPFPMDKFWRAEEMIRAACPAARVALWRRLPWSNSCGFTRPLT